MKCKVCGRNAESEYCFRHKPRSPLPVKNALVADIEKRKEIDDMRTFFLWIWKKRRHVSEISGVRLGKEPLTVYFHHILPKEKYPDAKFDEENIILLNLEEHDNLERDMYKYDVVNQRRETLLEKYGK